MMTTQSDTAVGPAAAMMARIRAKCIARYRLAANRPGHPEELWQIGHPDTGMSVVYGCFAVRIRLHSGREWLAYADFDPQIGLTDAAIRRLFDILDPHFGWTPRGFPHPSAAGPIDPKLAALYRPPIGGFGGINDPTINLKAT
jgi:hypothetical protein